MKQLILFLTIGLFWMHQSYSQPIVMIKGYKDSLALKARVMHYLDYLDINEKVHLSIHFTIYLPNHVEGITFSLNAPNPSIYQVIRVRIDARLNKTQQWLVLAHEMIHVEQMVKGELMIIDNRQVKWKGRKYLCQRRNHPYTPWEKDAYKKGKILAGLEYLEPEVPLAVADECR